MLQCWKCLWPFETVSHRMCAAHFFWLTAAVVAVLIAHSAAVSYPQAYQVRADGAYPRAVQLRNGSVLACVDASNDSNQVHTRRGERDIEIHKRKRKRERSESEKKREGDPLSLPYCSPSH